MRNEDIGTSFPLLSSSVITVLNSGESKSITWNQRDNSEELIRPAHYSGLIASGSQMASSTFFISL